MPRFIILDSNNKVIAVRSGLSIVEGEIESNDGEIGQIMQLDGTFITPEPVPIEPIKSLDEQMLELKQNQVAANRAVDETSTTQQELLELLTETGVIS